MNDSCLEAEIAVAGATNVGTTVAGAAGGKIDTIVFQAMESFQIVYRGLTI